MASSGSVVLVLPIWNCKDFSIKDCVYFRDISQAYYLIFKKDGVMITDRELGKTAFCLNILSLNMFKTYDASSTKYDWY